MAERVALYPGSFDPLTMGHVDVLERARVIFDRVVVGVLTNPGKTPLFSVQERVALVTDHVGGRPGLEVATFEGLTVDFAKQIGAAAIVRGLRATSDFEGEFQMTLMNRRLAPDIHTVFLMTSFANVYVSSSIIKEVCRLGGDIKDFVPPASAQALQSKFGQSPQEGNQ